MSLGGLVLAGGLGSRMGYKNKGLMPFGGQYLIDPAIQVLKKQCKYVAISANQDIQHYQQKGLDVWSDYAPWLGLGPLGGVYSSVSQFPLSIDTIQVLPCDSPFISEQVITKLSQQLNLQYTKAVYAKSENQIYPVIFQFKRQDLGELKQYLLTQSKHSIRQWLHQMQAVAIDFEDDAQFININDFQTLQRYLA